VGVLCNTSYKPLPTTPKPKRPIFNFVADTIKILSVKLVNCFVKTLIKREGSFLLAGH
jgi:hypothetical protein